MLNNPNAKPYVDERKAKRTVLVSLMANYGLSLHDARAVYHAGHSKSAKTHTRKVL